MENLPQRTPADFIYEYRKEKCLQESSLLFAYFDDSTDLDTWARNVGKEIEGYQRHFDRVFQPNWEFFLVKPVEESAIKDRLFSSRHPGMNIPKHTKLITSQLVFMGYEIGSDTQMLESFSGDILEKMAKYKIINIHSPKKNLHNFIRKGLNAGAYHSLIEKDIEKVWNKKEIIKSSDERLDPYRDFINQLDMDSI